MKKRLFMGLVALAAVILTSCQKDQVINQTPVQNAIEFGTYVGRDALTKGSVLDLTALQTSGFGVFAYYTDNGDYDASTSTLNYMNNQKVEWNTSTGWTYSPVKYWPNESSDKLSFFAYAPYENTRTTSGSYTGDPKFTVSVDADAKKHIDYTYATAGSGITSLMNITKQSVNGKIPFVFKHAMSRVGFKVEAVIDELTNVENGNADKDYENIDFNSSETTITVQEVELYATGGFYTEATLNLNGGTWIKDELNRTTPSYKLTKDGNHFTAVCNGVKINKEQLNDASSYIFMVPADLTTSKVKIRVKYTVTTNDANLAGGKSEIINDITSDQFGFNFVQGYAYNFVLHLGLTSVKLSADVSEWIPADGEEFAVNVPINFN